MANSILLEVVNNDLRSVAEQMTVTMVRSSYSTIVKEMMDCSSAIFDAKGRMLKFATVFSNAAFMGIPLSAAVLED